LEAHPNPGAARERPLGIGQLLQTTNLHVFWVQDDAIRTPEKLEAAENLIAQFAANGWTESDAQAMAARIVLWRQTDASRVPDAPFHAVNKLTQLPGGAGITPELLDAFTVYSQALVPLPTAAPAAVRRALIWADRQQSGGHRWLTDDPQIGAESGAADPTALIGEVLRVQACLRGSAAAQCRAAAVRVTGNINKPL